MVWMFVVFVRFCVFGVVVVKGVELFKKDLVTCVRMDFFTLVSFDDDASWMFEVDEMM